MLPLVLAHKSLIFHSRFEEELEVLNTLPHVLAIISVLFLSGRGPPAPDLPMVCLPQQLTAEVCQTFKGKVQVGHHLVAPQPLGNSPCSRPVERRGAPGLGSGFPARVLDTHSLLFRRPGLARGRGM